MSVPIAKLLTAIQKGTWQNMIMQWISTKDKLPEIKGERYLVLVSDGSCGVAWWEGNWECWDDYVSNEVTYGKVTHWMPLPEPPKS